MALTAYQQTTRRILADQGFARFYEGDLTDWINIARRQAAAEGEAIRVLGTIPTVAAQQAYAFSAITLPISQGYNSVLAIRMMSAGGVWLTPRAWDWFFQYHIAPGPVTGTPAVWAQLGQGSSGTFYLAPTPTAVATITADTVVLPNNLESDGDTDALPYPFTDAVPYYAAYMALLTAREVEAAQVMYLNYERFMLRARAESTPSALPEQYPGARGAKLAAAQTPILPMATVNPPQGGA